MQPLNPGATVGVLGGGQLGRMLAIAARRMGYRVGVFSPEDDAPGVQVADWAVIAPYSDLAAVREFAARVNVVTFEFENVPAETAEAAAECGPVHPKGNVLFVAQNRAREKSALAGLGLPLPAFSVIQHEADLPEAAPLVGDKAVLKSASSGYDGKGQRVVTSAAELEQAWRDLGEVPAVLEAWVPFEREVSVVGARGQDGTIVVFDVFENHHVNHILDVTRCPGRLSASDTLAAQNIARRILEGLEVVGVLCVELFHCGEGELLVNEIAPRPHNSGHLTIDNHDTSQFEQQLRAVCGLPLGSVAPLRPGAAMVNLLGDLWSGGEPDWTEVVGEPGVALHLYGKTEARPGRKMGHITASAADVETAVKAALRARHKMQG